MTMMNYEATVQIRNKSEREIEIAIEPWGDVFLLAKNKKVSIESRGPANGSPELEIQANKITYYGWVGSTVRFIQDGKEISATHTTSLPIPSIPFSSE